MNVKVWTRNKQKVTDPRFEAISFEEIITSSDIISLHIPSTGETINKMNQAVFQKMKENVILINTSRGDLINEEDLYEGLKMKKPAFAALDVLKVEPPVEKSPLFELDNCIITPHIAWASKQAREKLMDMTVDNIVGYIEGKPLNNLAAVK
jgi:glycerate dehydrogenase